MAKSSILSLLLLATAATVSAQPSPAAAQTATVSMPAQIADLLAPGSLIADKSVAAFAQNFRASALANPQGAALEKQYPGALDAAEKAGEAVVGAAMRQGAPALQTQIASLIADNFDAVEQQGLLDFLRSPAGHRLVAMGDQMYDRSKLSAAMAKSGGKLTQQDIASALDPNFVNKVPPADIEQMTAFSASPAGRKLAAVTPQMQQIIAIWTTETVAKAQPQMQQAIAAAVAKVKQGAPSGG